MNRLFVAFITALLISVLSTAVHPHWNIALAVDMQRQPSDIVATEEQPGSGNGVLLPIALLLLFIGVFVVRSLQALQDRLGDDGGSSGLELFGPLSRAACKLGMHAGAWRNDDPDYCIETRDCVICGRTQYRENHAPYGDWVYLEPGKCRQGRVCPRCGYYKYYREFHQWSDGSRCLRCGKGKPSPGP